MEYNRLIIMVGGTNDRTVMVRANSPEGHREMDMLREWLKEDIAKLFENAAMFYDSEIISS